MEKDQKTYEEQKREREAKIVQAIKDLGGVSEVHSLYIGCKNRDEKRSMRKKIKKLINDRVKLNEKKNRNQA